MNLPKEKSKVELGFPERATWLLFGQPKVGKTSSVCTWPEPLLIEMEPGGADYVEAYKVQVSSLVELREVWTALKAELKATGMLPYQTIVLDTVDKISDWVEDEVAGRYGATKLGEAKVFGADFSAHRNDIMNMLTSFGQFPASLVIVAHSRATSQQEMGGEAVKVLDLPGKFGRTLLSAVSHVLFMEALVLPSGAVERRFVFAPSSLVEAGSRHPVLTAARTCAPTYQALRALFVEPKPHSVELPKKEA